jgi:mannan endo-1,4-beta-mannosidase
MKKQIRKIILFFSIFFLISLLISPEFNIRIWRTQKPEIQSLSRDEKTVPSALPGTQTNSLPVKASAPGFYIQGRHLYAKDGEKVILRGVNRMAVWVEPTGNFSLPQIEKIGANVVRIMWGIGKPDEEFDEIVRNTVKLGMIPMIEIHDATGDWSKLPKVIDYWLNPANVAVIKRHENYLLVNIANEAGWFVSDDAFRTEYLLAVTRMRAAGIHVPLIIDASCWSRNMEQLLNTGLWLQQQDPDRNLMFSVHWYDSDNNKERITTALENAVALNLPLIVGEFAHKEVGCRGAIAYQHLLKECQRLEIGWLAWEWGGEPHNADCREMDMTPSGHFEDLQGWGKEVAVTDPNSIKNTSVRPQFILNGGN